MTSTIPNRAAPAARGTDDQPEREDLVEDILDQLGPVMAHQRHAVAHVWNDRSVSKTNLHVLMLMEQLGSLPMGRLATLVDVSLPSLTGIVDRMEEHGLVSRGRDENDRRVVVVQLADKGRQILVELEQARRDLLRRVLKQMSVADQQACLGVVRTMHRIVDQLEPEGHGAWPCANPSHLSPPTQATHD